MPEEIKSLILAIVTTDVTHVGGGAPIFIARDDQEFHTIAFNLEQALDGMVHEITPSTYIIVKH